MTKFGRRRNSIDSVNDLVSSVQQEESCLRITTAVFLDVKGALNCITHEAISDALVEIGVGQCFVDCVANCLHGWHIYMATPTGNTALHRVTPDVPQGGVLSPTLFNVTVIGLPKVLTSSAQISIYPDDICL